MIDKESIEYLGKTLSVKGRLVEADIKDLGWLWEQTLSEATFADPRLAFYVLIAIGRAYLRGRNVRMGNSQGLVRHQWTEVGLMTILVRYVADETVFDCLHQAGVTSVAAFSSALNSYFDILDEAKRITGERP